MESKQDLRKMYLQIRDQLTEEQLKSASQELCKHLSHWVAEQGFSQIAAYQSFHQEPLIDDFIAGFSLDRVFFPVVLASRGFMEFYRFDKNQSSHINRYGIREPSLQQEHKLIADARTLILIPALAFDRQGYRLGYGAGYYDRYLTQFPGVRVGICLEQFLIERLPRDPHDLPVQYLVTNRQFYSHSPFVSGSY